MNPEILNPEITSIYPQTLSSTYQEVNPDTRMSTKTLSLINRNRQMQETKHTQKNIPRSFFYDENVINEGISACNHSVIGKIITDKPIHINSIQNGLESIWGSPPGLKIQDLGGKLLQFFMNDLADRDRILYGNPWIFRNSWLVVKAWDRETDYHNLDFDHVPIWIQLWGLPTHCM
jgi:hypothetical protein